MTRKIILCLTLALALPLTACGDAVDPAEFADISDYKTWPMVETAGALPAHLDTVRLIFVNDTARMYPGVGQFLPGSVIVKEVRDNRGDDTAGDLRYVAIMRKLTEAEAPDGIELEQGWLFTIVSEVGKTEKTGTCWSTCHVQAPYDGAWLDYGQIQ